MLTPVVPRPHRIRIAPNSLGATTPPAAAASCNAARPGPRSIRCS
jgi:hypothetical protein